MSLFNEIFPINTMLKWMFNPKMVNSKKQLIQSIFWLYYRLQRSWGKVIFSQESVILSTGGGGCLLPGGVCSGGGVPGPGGCLVETPPGWLLLRTVRILLGCILVKFKYFLLRNLFETKLLFEHFNPTSLLL